MRRSISLPEMGCQPAAARYICTHVSWRWFIASRKHFGTEEQLGGIEATLAQAPFGVHGGVNPQAPLGFARDSRCDKMPVEAFHG